MTIRIFEAPGEAAEPVEQAKVSIVARVLFCFWAAVVAMLPAVGAAYAAWLVVNVFRGITDAETAGLAHVMGGLHVSNIPLIIALTVAGFLAFGMALVLAINSKRRMAAVGLPFSIAIPIMAATPGLFLWTAESRVVDLLSDKLDNNVSVPVFAQTITSLLILTLALGLLIQGLTVVFALVSLLIPVRSRSEPDSAPRAFVWLVSGVLLLTFAGLFFVLA